MIETISHQNTLRFGLGLIRVLLFIQQLLFPSSFLFLFMLLMQFSSLLNLFLSSSLFRKCFDINFLMFASHPLGTIVDTCNFCFVIIVKSLSVFGVTKTIWPGDLPSLVFPFRFIFNFDFFSDFLNGFSICFCLFCFFSGSVFSFVFCWSWCWCSGSSGWIFFIFLLGITIYTIDLFVGISLFFTSIWIVK